MEQLITFGTVWTWVMLERINSIDNIPAVLETSEHVQEKLNFIIMGKENYFSKNDLSYFCDSQKKRSFRISSKTG